MQQRRFVATVAIFSLAALTLISGCGGGGGGGSQPSPAPSPTPSPLPSPSGLPSPSPTPSPTPTPNPSPSPSPSPAVQTVYQNNFEGAIGTEWSDTSTATTPVGARRYLGPFGEEAVHLSLTNLPAHSRMTVTFKLYLIGTWDGNTVIDVANERVGPDIWSLSVDNATLLRTTFSNWDMGPSSLIETQSYPDAFGAGSHPARTGASENNTLGYTTAAPYPAPYMDSVYDLSYSTTHSASTATITFSGLETVNDNVFADEGWGIDDVVVTVQ